MNLIDLTKLLSRGCTGGLAAIRQITKLQPAGGAGDKVFPPTYADGTYAEEQRKIDGASVKTVLLDSVQSMANRFEDALLAARRAGRLSMPMFEMTVAGHEVNSLTTPHRVHDAIFRDSHWDGKLFRESVNGLRLVSARAWNATAFYEYAPTVLLLGTWDSQSGGGVNTAKIARALVSEIIALDVERGVRTSSRIDPLGIRLMRDVIQMVESDGSRWKFIEPTTDVGKEEKKSKKSEVKGVRPSEINHGNVTPTITGPDGPGGVTFREALQTTVLSMAQLRKLRFPDSTGAPDQERDIAGRVVIAALGLHAVALFQEEGYQLRSRCQLVPVETPKFELIGRTSGEREEFDLDVSTTGEVLESAVEAAAKHGLKWRKETIRLEPREDLVKLVTLSDKSVAVAEKE
jgi:CRISPR-associated protein Csb1